jgi:aspartate racemase
MTTQAPARRGDRQAPSEVTVAEAVMAEESTDPMVWPHLIGIVGGLGPHSHLCLEENLLQAAERAAGRQLADQDYPPWLLSSIPQTPDRTRALLEGGPSPVPLLVESITRLTGSDRVRGADFVLIACNTAHAFLDEVQAQVSVPLLDMIEETVRAAGRAVPAGGTVGLLGTTGILKAQIYEQAGQRLGIDLRFVSPLDRSWDGVPGEVQQEKLVMEPIYGPLLPDGRTRQGGGIKSGAHRGERAGALRQCLEEAARLLASVGAQRIITACTEIPLVLPSPGAAGIEVIDPLRIAAEAAIAIARGVRPLPPRHLDVGPPRVSSLVE